MAVLTRFAWVNALLLVFLGLGVALVAAGPAAASTKADVEAETKVDLVWIGSILDIPAMPPSADAGKDEAGRIVEAYGGCDAIGDEITRQMKLLDYAYHHDDPAGYVEAFDAITLLRWAGRVFCGWP
jgi:hypothetical protein